MCAAASSYGDKSGAGLRRGAPGPLGVEFKNAVGNLYREKVVRGGVEVRLAECTVWLNNGEV